MLLDKFLLSRQVFGWQLNLCEVFPRVRAKKCGIISIDMAKFGFKFFWSYFLWLVTLARLRLVIINCG